MTHGRTAFVQDDAHRPQNRRRQSGRSCAKSLHGVAFLSWNQHPEPTGSRRATPPLLFNIGRGNAGTTLRDTGLPVIIVTHMYGPAVRRKRFLSVWRM